MELGGELSSGASLPLPPAFAASRSTPLVGRTAELAGVARALATARLGAPTTVLVAGEPGIGKTRLAAEAGARASEAGFVVMYGGADEAHDEGLRPIAAAFGGWAAAVGQERARATLGDVTGAIAHIVPELGDAHAPADAHSLYAAVATALARIAEEDGLLLVLDDFHAADEGTVAIVRHVVRAPIRLPVTLLALHRPGEAAGPHATLLDELAGREGVEQAALAGLGSADAGALIANVAGRPPDEALGRLGERLASVTAGNPLYLTELTRHLIETDRFDEALDGDTESLGEPQGRLRELAVQRVERLGPSSAEILRSAAVIGGDVRPAVLRAVTGMSDEQVSGALDGAARSGLLCPADGDGGGPRVAFVHTVVQRALADSVSGARRAELHAAIADALEAEPDVERPGRTAAIARHRLAALPDRPRAAIDATAAAGRDALARLAPHEAVERFTVALELLEEWASGEAGLRDELRIGLGDGQRMVGDPAFRETLLAAGRSARERGDSPLLLRAVLANSRGFVSASGEVDRDRVELLEAALAAAGEGADRARVLALLASERTFDADAHERRRLAGEAVAAARALEDPATLCAVLTLVFCPTSAPASLAVRLGEMSEAVGLADRVGDPLAQFGALHWLGVAHVQAGRFDDAVRTIDREAALAERLGEPAAQWLAHYARANLAAMFGHLEQAEALAAVALEHATASGQPDALTLYAMQLAPIRFEQGRLGELQPLVAQAVAESPRLPALRALLALALCEAELPAQAREVLAGDAEDGFARLPDDMTRHVALTLYADVTARVGDAAAAATLAELLEPWSDQVAYTGIGGWGPIRRALGRVLAVTGRLDDAERALTDAAEQATRAGTQLWAARAQADAAEVLLRRRADGDRARALDLLGAARETARRLGAGGIERRARMLADRERAVDALGRAGGRAPALAGAPSAAETRSGRSAAAPAEPRVGILRRQGAVWHVSVGGRTATVRDGRGMAHLARLLLDPGVEVSALELAAEGAGDLTVAGGSERGEPLLDEAAKRAFRERVSELEEEREEALSFNDPERAARAAEELDALRSELTRSLGLAGRDRRTSSAGERARLSVTRAIRRTIGRIAEQDPSLGRELDASVSTGTLCCYRSAPGRAIEWRQDAG